MSKDELKPKNVKNRVILLRALPYKGCMVYVRMIGTDLFMYDLVYNNEIYSGNMVFTPRNGQTKLSKDEIQKATSLLWAGAVATIDLQLGEAPAEGKNKKAAEMIVNVSEAKN